MGIKLKTLSGLLVLVAASTTVPSVASAQTETPSYETTNDVFERAFFQHDRNFYQNGNIKRQARLISGIIWFGFPQFLPRK